MGLKTIDLEYILSERTISILAGFCWRVQIESLASMPLALKIHGESPSSSLKNRASPRVSVSIR